jgi:phenylacetic acid degradation operon negative regulatory protein
VQDGELIFGIMSSLDKPEYSVGDLKYLTKPFAISESNLRTALCRMLKKGILEKKRVGRQAFYARSGKGQTLGANVALRFREPDRSDWAGTWWGVCFSISNTDKRDRYRIRKKLLNYHFRPLYSGFWIRPYSITQNMAAVLNTDYINKSARLIRFTPEKTFTVEFIIRLWEMNKINVGLGKGLELMARHENLSEQSPERAFVNLIKIGGQVVRILFTDPLLPACYLPPDWRAGHLRNKFAIFISQAKEKSKPFWEQIFQEDVPYENKQHHA